MYKQQNLWSEEEIKIIKTTLHLMPKKVKLLLPNRTTRAINTARTTYRNQLGLNKRVGNKADCYKLSYKPDKKYNSQLLMWV